MSAAMLAPLTAGARGRAGRGGAAAVSGRGVAVPGPDVGQDATAPVIRGRGLCTTERAGAHSLQFGTYAARTAELLAALAVRPVPSCAASLTRGVNDQPPSDVCSGKAAPRSLRRARPDHRYPACCEMPGILSLPDRRHDSASSVMVRGSRGGLRPGCRDVNRAD